VRKVAHSLSAKQAFMADAHMLKRHFSQVVSGVVPGHWLPHCVAAQSSRSAASETPSGVVVKQFCEQLESPGLHACTQLTTVVQFVSPAQVQ
jgi:hypothetical protein